MKLTHITLTKKTMNFAVEEQPVWMRPCSRPDRPLLPLIAVPLVRGLLRLALWFALLEIRHRGLRQAVAAAGIKALTASATGIGFILRRFNASAPASIHRQLESNSN